MTDDDIIHPPHDGLHYQDVLSALSKKRSVQRYLEIGVCGGQTFAKISCETAIAIDPYFLLNTNVMFGKKQAFFFQMESDSFFRTTDANRYLGGAPDLVILDGMHVFEYLLRDFHNVEKICAKHTLIAIHDCLPLTRTMANRSEEITREMSKGSFYENWWTGDVWKLVPIIKKYRPDLRIVAVNAPPTGLVFITNLDTQSQVLSDKYLDIVGEFMGESSSKALDSFYETIEIVTTEAILNHFDHSLYFRS
jgi:hypothetical protein